MANVPIIDRIKIPTREDIGPYHYTEKTGATDKKPATKKNSTSSKETSTSNSENLLNAVSRPFGANLSITGQTTIIGADDMKDESKVAPTNRHFVWRDKAQLKVTTGRESDEVFGDRTTISANLKTIAEKIDGWCALCGTDQQYFMESIQKIDEQERPMSSRTQSSTKQFALPQTQ
ncbi:hypothetical protein LOAG_12316 [Loa loa]|uniref:Phosphoprotein n=1 Tax=Loa loa TaxID=7209 RepID=A0A1I7VEQ2_LOALO|nr:hypothetical protein LOAG_12316 [Loa loa]EFO16192.2 hypothetical protein LOAG_12316 [Loa loa]